MQLVQQHLRTEMLRRQAIAEQLEQQHADGQENSDDETVVMEEQQQQQEQEQEQEENPWGPQF
jgi:predicted kinase